MAFTIAVAGKGGVGKTTVAGLIVRELVERGDGPVLAIDADPNTNFHQVLGLTVERTIGELREETLQRIKDLPPGVTKDQYLEYGLQQCLVESNGVDLLAMGRGEGPFCYCAVNHVYGLQARRCRDLPHERGARLRAGVRLFGDGAGATRSPARR